jgi:hypothetical protein
VLEEMVFSLPPEIVVAPGVEAKLDLIVVPPRPVNDDPNAMEIALVGEENLFPPVLCVWRVSLDHALQNSSFKQMDPNSYVPSETKFKIPGYDDFEPAIPGHPLASGSIGNFNASSLFFSAFI